MKPFIVSLAIILIGVSGLTYTSDLTRYVTTQEHLQALSEECAAYAALAIEEYEGEIRINENLAKEHATDLINYANAFMPCFKTGRIMFDPYCENEGFLVNQDNYSVQVNLVYISDVDFFRLSIIPSKYEIRHKSSYEWL